jgi:hypothetical protein
MALRVYNSYIAYTRLEPRKAEALEPSPLRSPGIGLVNMLYDVLYDIIYHVSLLAVT